MGKYTSYLDGMDVVDIRQNEAGYNYYGYNRWGNPEWAIMRETIDGSELRIKVGNSDYETNFVNRGSLTGWKRPNNIG